MLELCERAAARPKADLEAIGAIACPVLLVLGSDDDPRRLRQAEVMRDAHDRTEIVVVEGGRHAVHKDHRAEVVGRHRRVPRPSRQGPSLARQREAWSERNGVRSRIENQISAEEESRLAEVPGWPIPRV